MTMPMTKRAREDNHRGEKDKIMNKGTTNKDCTRCNETEF